MDDVDTKVDIIVDTDVDTLHEYAQDWEGFCEIARVEKTKRNAVNLSC